MDQNEVTPREEEGKHLMQIIKEDIKSMLEEEEEEPKDWVQDLREHIDSTLGEIEKADAQKQEEQIIYSSNKKGKSKPLKVLSKTGGIMSKPSYHTLENKDLPNELVGKTLQGCLLKGCSLTNTQSHDIELDKYVTQLAKELNVTKLAKELNITGPDSELSKIMERMVGDRMSEMETRIGRMEARIEIELGKIMEGMILDKTSAMQKQMAKMQAQIEEQDEHHRQWRRYLENEQEEQNQKWDLERTGLWDEVEEVKGLAKEMAVARGTSNTQYDSYLRKYHAVLVLLGACDKKHEEEEGSSSGVGTNPIPKEDWYTVCGWGADGEPYRLPSVEGVLDNRGREYTVQIDGDYLLSFSGKMSLCGGGERQARIAVNMGQRTKFYFSEQVSDTSTQARRMDICVPVLTLRKGDRISVQIIHWSAVMASLQINESYFSVQLWRGID